MLLFHYACLQQAFNQSVPFGPEHVHESTQLRLPGFCRFCYGGAFGSHFIHRGSHNEPIQKPKGFPIVTQGRCITLSNLPVKANEIRNCFVILVPYLRTFYAQCGFVHAIMDNHEILAAQFHRHKTQFKVLVHIYTSHIILTLCK